MSLPALYAYVFRSGQFNDAVLSQLKGAQLPRISWQSLANLEIPLPPLEVQKETVAEIEGYQKVIDGARAVIDNYRPHIPIDPSWPMVELEAVCTKIGSGSTPRGGQSTYRTEGVPFIRSQNVLMNRFSRDGLTYISKATHHLMSNTEVKPGDILLNITGASIGRICVVPTEICPANVNQHVSIVRTDSSSLLPTYLACFLASDGFQRHIMKIQAGGTRQALTKAQIQRFSIPRPSVETQVAVVAEIETEQALITANCELIKRFEEKIRMAIEPVLGDNQINVLATTVGFETIKP